MSKTQDIELSRIKYLCAVVVEVIIIIIIVIKRKNTNTQKVCLNQGPLKKTDIDLIYIYFFHSSYLSYLRLKVSI